MLKVLYRNTNRIHEHGGRASEVLHPVKPGDVSPGQNGGEALRAAVRARDVDRAEATFAALAQGSPADAFNELLVAVHDNTEVHRVVLPYRAWDLLDVVGPQFAHAMLRQSVRYCVKNEQSSANSESAGARKVLPAMLDQFHLAGKALGTRSADDAWVDAMSQTIFGSTPEQAAEATAAALSEGFAPDALGEAISLAANQLVLRDAGRTPREESPGKPIGSVHGDSIGVHACDSANAWRNMARVTNPRNAYASLILGAYQVALDRVQRGGDFLHWEPLPVTWQLERITATEPDVLLRELDIAVRGNLQVAGLRRSASLRHAGARSARRARCVADVRGERRRRVARREVLSHVQRRIRHHPTGIPLAATDSPGPRNRQRVRPTRRRLRRSQRPVETGVIAPRESRVPCLRPQACEDGWRSLHMLAQREHGTQVRRLSRHLPIDNRLKRIGQHQHVERQVVDARYSATSSSAT